MVSLAAAVAEPSGKWHLRVGNTAGLVVALNDVYDAVHSSSSCMRSISTIPVGKSGGEGGETGPVTGVSITVPLSTVHVQYSTWYGIASKRISE